MEGTKAEVGSLESSLLLIVQEHHQKTLRIRDQTDKAKKEALRTAVHVSELLVDTINGGVEESFVNEKRIELEIRALVSTIMRYTKQTNQWLAASHAMNSVLKEIGDFENWMKTMDYDCKSINAAIRNIHQLAYIRKPILTCWVLVLLVLILLTKQERKRRVCSEVSEICSILESLPRVFPF